MGEREVKIVSDSLVVPSRARGTEGNYTLSNLDYMMGLHNVRLVYYYKNISKQEHLILINNLKKSLEKFLKSYRPACGRLLERENVNWEIKCNDDGVQVFEAKVDSTLENWLKKVDRSAELKLCRWKDSGTDSARSSLVFVQFNAFKGDGLAIGISCGHNLADPSCVTQLMKVWGETHRGVPVAHKAIVEPSRLQVRGNKNKTEATSHYELTMQREIRSYSDPKTLIFKFSHDMVQRCMSQIEGGNYRYRGVTAFEALTALFCAACTRAKNQQEAKLSICTEFRGKLLNPLTPGFFGNVLLFSVVSMKPKDFNDLSYFAKAIHDNQSRLGTEEEFLSVLEWLENQKISKGQLPNLSYLYGTHLTAINGEKFFTYDCVFEQGEKPEHVSYYVEPVRGEGLIFVLPSAEGNLSRTVMLTLPEQQARHIRKDPAIEKFKPKLWMK